MYSLVISNPAQALMEALETDLLDFDRSCLICPIFSNHAMRERKSLLPSDSDKIGHWLLIHYNFRTLETRVIDSLGRNNSSVSELALVAFSKKNSKAFSFFRSEQFSEIDTERFKYIDFQRKLRPSFS